MKQFRALVASVSETEILSVLVTISQIVGIFKIVVLASQKSVMTLLGLTSLHI